MRLLLARGMLRLGSTDLRHAWEDFVCAGKASRPLLQSDMIIFGLLGMAVMNDAADAMTTLMLQQHIDEEFLRQMLADLDEISFSRGLEGAVENEVRFSRLSMYIEGDSSIWILASLAETSQNRAFERYIDRNTLCRKVNQFADEYREVYSIEDVGERIKRLGRWQNERENYKVDTSNYQYLLDTLWLRYLTPAGQKCSAISEMVSDTIIIASPGYSDLLITMLAVAEKYRLLKVAVLIRLHKIKTGDYPSSLAALEVTDRQMLVDSFSGKPFVFRSDGDSILVYSIGENQRDDLGVSAEDISSGDLVVKVVKF